MDNAYFRGVGIGLVIAWVTGALAYWRKKEQRTTVAKQLILLELVLSVIFILVGYLINT